LRIHNLITSAAEDSSDRAGTLSRTCCGWFTASNSKRRRDTPIGIMMKQLSPVQQWFS
jgi:hypothetical protein